MAKEREVVISPEKVLLNLEGSGIPTVGASMSWGGSANEVQTLSVTGTPTAGTFKLRYMGYPGAETDETTTALTFDEASADVDAALEALTSIGVADVACAGGPLPGTPITITFETLLAAKPIYPLQLTAIALTGGTEPAPSIARTTRGWSAWTELPTLDEEGVELTLLTEGDPITPAGAKMPTEEPIVKRGVSKILVHCHGSHSDVLKYAIADVYDGTTYLESGADRVYYALAVKTRNSVWQVYKVSPSGNVPLSWANSSGGLVAFEFICYEEKYGARGASNYRRTKIEV